MSAEPKLSEADPATTPPPTPAATLAAARKALLLGYSPTESSGAEFRERLGSLYEDWLTERASELGIVDGSGFAVVAVGALGRREMVGYSDLDLVLVHDDRFPDDVAAKADGLWYPIWDSGVGLDHSVRTVPEALRVARTDVTAALGLLDARFIAGDEDLAALMIASVRNLWRVEARTRLPEVVEQAQQRWKRAGDIAQRAEPDLKNGRGGLRDVQLLNALALAQLTDGLGRLSPERPDSPVSAAYERVLDVRTQLHLIAGRGRDQVQAQDADQIAAALQLGDRFDLARALSDAARTTQFAVDTGLRTATNAVGRRGLSRLRRLPMRRPLDEGVVEHEGEVVLARNTIPSQDSGLVLRVAAASARHDLPINGPVLERLAQYAPPLPEPWPAEPLDDLLVLLSSGSSMVAPIEALDRTGLWGAMFPEWDRVRDLPPRDAVHTWTVDRHLVETAVYASGLTTSVSRPDLLLLGALIHDLGKGSGRDHSVVGAELALIVGKRLGLWPQDVQLVSEMVRHHLLLPSVATRRDPSDPAVVESVAETLGHSRQLVELLGALAEADSQATGPGMWGDWKASLIRGLVRRVLDLIGGRPADEPDPLTAEQIALAEAGGVHVRLEAGEGPTTYLATLVAPDQPGLLSKMAGVIALAGLHAHSADVRSHGGSAVNTFTVMPTFGDPPDVQVLRQRLVAAIDGSLDLPAKLAERQAKATASADDGAQVPVVRVLAPPHVQWIDDDASGTLLLEVRAVDQQALLARVSAVLERAGADIGWAKVSTLGSTVVDTFCVELPRDTPAARDEIARAVLRACPGGEKQQAKK
ncbi:MAG: [protein-PII] uridylyltransferase [Gordonia sp. (in: high G+C Gram-positive bacteria)]